MRILITLLAIIILTSCKKEETSSNVCHQEMKIRFESELKCTEENKMEVNLYSGRYEGNDIYFSMTMCPSCNTIPPQFGYKCGGERINISDFNTKVTDIKQIYNSCTNKFID